MSSIITKKRIAKSLKQLMSKTDFEKISVRLIMEQAGIRRQTFYNYFVDKYELLEWIFNTDLQEQITDNLEYISGYQLVEELFHFFYQNREFYRTLFLIVDQNDFNSYFYQYCAQTIEKVIREYRKQPFTTDFDHDFFVTYHATTLLTAIKYNIIEQHGDYRSVSTHYLHLLKLAIRHY